MGTGPGGVSKVGDWPLGHYKCPVMVESILHGPASLIDNNLNPGFQKPSVGGPIFFDRRPDFLKKGGPLKKKIGGL